MESRIARAGGFSRIFCVAGSGERLVSLIGLPAVSEIVAVDVNPEALQLLRLKLAALQSLPPEVYLQFCGFERAAAEWRIQTWLDLQDRVSEGCRLFWNRRLRLVAGGIANAGHFERYLRRIRPLVRGFLGPGFDARRDAGVEGLRGFPWRRWHILSRCFSAWPCYRLFGLRDPAFLASDASRARVTTALTKALRDASAANNCMWHIIFRGHVRDMPSASMPGSARPDWLRQSREVLRTGATRITFREGDLLAVLRSEGPSRLAGSLVSASDLLSFCDFSYVEALVDLLRGTGSTLVLRSFLRNRLGPLQLASLDRRCRAVVDWSARERTGMYQVYELRM